MARPSILSAITDRVLTQAAARIDRGVLAGMERRMRTIPPRRGIPSRARLLELAAHYSAGTLALPSRFFAEPAPLADADVTVTDVGPGPEGAQVLDLAFPSTYQPFLPEYLDEHERHRENLVARVRLYRCGRRRPTEPQPRPVMICIHGWGGGAWWLEERAFVVSYWLHHGFDIALFQLPFHGGRTPEGGAASAMFPSANVVRTNEAFGQAIHDLRALRGYLAREGAPVGVAGMSLGGYTTALWASVDDQLAFAVPWIPAVDMADLMWRHSETSPARRHAAKDGVDADLLREVFAVHAPTSRPPRLPAERLLIVAGRGDQITPPDQAQLLWRHWGCSIHWFAGGHLAQLGRAEALRAARRQLHRLGLGGGASPRVSAAEAPTARQAASAAAERRCAEPNEAIS